MRLNHFLLAGLTLLLFSCTQTYIVTFSGSTGGTVSDIGGEYDEGTTVSVSAQPETGYEFTGWSDGSSQNPRTISVSQNLNLTALFGKQQFSVSVNTQGEGTVATSGATGQGSFEYGSSARFEAVPAAGWYFDSWTGNSSGNSNPLTVSIDGPKSITAVFKRKKFDLTVSVQGEGTVTEQIIVQPGQYDYETQVKLTAVPEEGWEFVNWSGDIGSTENPVNVTVSTPKNVTANFKELEIVSIEVLNPIDSLIISRKHKFQILGTYSNGNHIDLTDLVTLDLTDEKIKLVENNEFIAGKSGQTSLKISYNDKQIIEDLYVSFYEEVLDETNAYLKENNKSSKINVPVVIINFLPTSDGIEISPEYKPEGTGLIKWYYYSYHNINENWCKNNPNDSLCKVGSVEMYKIRAMEINNFVKYAIEEGSKFRNFNQINSDQSIAIETIKYFNFYELQTKNYGRGGNEANTPSPDYEWLFNIIDLEELVNNQGVKEVWMSNPSPEFNYPESNMSSPITGDISNSYRIQNDLPIYNKTYKVFGIPLDRGPAEAVHCRGHQIEAQFSHIEKNKKFGEQLFWNKFVGINESGKPIGRSGATHFPPNTNVDYDYWNETLVESDIKNWRPQGGEKELVSYKNWTDIQYDYPFETIFWNKTKGIDNISGDAHYKWFIYWFQSIPGENNNIPYLRDGVEYTLTNWWDLFYNWDEAVTQGKTLWE